VRAFLKSRAVLGYHLILSPLFWECSHYRALPSTLTLRLTHGIKCGGITNLLGKSFGTWGTSWKCIGNIGEHNGNIKVQKNQTPKGKEARPLGCMLYYHLDE